MKKDLDLTSMLRGLGKVVEHAKPYLGLAFFVTLSLMYGFLLLQINVLSTAPVDDAKVTLETSTSPTLNVDANAATQLQSLKDNSSNVQSIFEQNRTDPFQE